MWNVMAMPRTLSSGWTFFYKFVFPILWIGGFGLGTVVLYLASNGPFGRVGSAPLRDMKWLFMSILLLGSVSIYWFCARLKAVRIDDQALYISNFLRETRIPLRDIAQVSENRWVNIHPVTIEFQGETEFGRSVMFMPKIRIFGWSSHPVVAELREAGRRAASA